MLSKPRESGKHRKPKVSNNKRMSAPPSQLGTQTMMLKQPQNGGLINNQNNGDLLDLFSDMNSSNNNNNNNGNNISVGDSNPFMDFTSDRPNLKVSKSNPFEYTNNSNNNDFLGGFGGMNSNNNENDDFFGSKSSSNPFDAISPKLLKQGSHPVSNNNNLNNNNNNNNSNNKMLGNSNHVYQDSHARLDPFMDLSMFDAPKNNNDAAGALLMIVDEKAESSTKKPASKIENNENENEDENIENWNSNNETDKKKSHKSQKHGNGKKRKSGIDSKDIKDSKDSKDSKDNKNSKEEKESEKEKEETNALEELHRGSALLKYPRRSGFPHFKHIQLSKDNTRIQWYSKRKALDETCILVKDIREVVKGQKTETFKKFQQRTLEKSSFSIVYGMDYKSLDVAAKSIDECQMWVKAVTELYKVSRSGGDLTQLKELYVGIKFKDRNRPRSRQGSGNFIRANNSKTLKIDPESLKEIEKDMETLHKNFKKVTELTLKAHIQKSDEYGNIQTVLSEIEERMEELTHEVANIRDTELAKREVWRANVDLNAMLEKVEVLSKLLDRRKSNLF